MPRSQTGHAERLDILCHSLGLDDHGRGRDYRNHYVTGPGSGDFGLCQAMTVEGLMTDHGTSPLYGGDTCFTVTEAGRQYVREHAPPPPPKLTRSQRRYQRYIDADSGLEFREWLDTPYASEDGR